MGVDIRIPIGAMFSLLGALLAIYGMITSGDPMYRQSLNINVNLWWGLVILVFGGLMLIFGLRAKPRPPRANGDGAAGSGH